MSAPSARVANLDRKLGVGLGVKLHPRNMALETWSNETWCVGKACGNYALSLALYGHFLAHFLARNEA